MTGAVRLRVALRCAQSKFQSQFPQNPTTHLHLAPGHATRAPVPDHHASAQRAG